MDFNTGSSSDEVSKHHWIVNNILVILVQAGRSTDRFSYFITEPLLALITSAKYLDAYNQAMQESPGQNDSTLIDHLGMLSTLIERIHKSGEYPEIVRALVKIRGDARRRVADLLGLIGMDFFKLAMKFPD